MLFALYEIKKRCIKKDMQHSSCIKAIEKMQQGVHANVEKDSRLCKCPHTVTPCDWVGNAIHYACLDKEMIHPQKVYSTLNSGGFGKIIWEEEKTR